MHATKLIKKFETPFQKIAENRAFTQGVEM